MSYKDGGWKNKYKIQKYAGQTSCGCREAGCNCVIKQQPYFEDVDPKAIYFVLRLDTDPHARVAARAYAESVRAENPQFARDILEKVNNCE